jgi:UDP-glucose 4-epimerase
MSVLVTGGTGFIGRYVIDRLRDDDEAVVSYDRASAGAGLPSEVGSVRGELFDLGRLAGTIAAPDVRGIVHAAGMSDPELSLGMPASTVTANAVGTLHLLEAARLAGFGGRIVLLSSMRVYGDEDVDVDEHPTLRPRTPFAATKAFGDLLGQVYAHGYGLDVVSLRLSETYGPGRRLPNLLERIIDAALARRPLRLDASADRPYRLVHAEDAARAIVAALAAPSPCSRVYDIAGEPVRLDQVVAIVRDRLPGADIEFEREPLGAGDPAGPVTATAADRELGYRPRWGLARGIDDFCAWREAEEAC